MRILIVGAPGERERLMSRLAPGAFDILAEFPTLGAARSSTLNADGILVAMPETPVPHPLPEPLTPREIEVLEQLVEGRSNKAIAGRLGISDQTVKFHVAAICGK